MSKYSLSQELIFSLFGSAAWQAHLIPAYPSNFSGKSEGSYIRLTVIHSGRGVNIVSSAGLLNIEIFTKAGDGPSEAIAIADKLDALLVGVYLQSTSVALQLGSSVLTPIGQDVSGLYRHLYSIPFSFYGAN